MSSSLSICWCRLSGRGFSFWFCIGCFLCAWWQNILRCCPKCLTMKNRCNIGLLQSHFLWVKEYHMRLYCRLFSIGDIYISRQIAIIIKHCMHFHSSFAVLYLAQSNNERHKLMVLESTKNILDLILNLTCLNPTCCPKLPSKW